MTADFLFSWWNLIFIVPFLLALLYLGLYATSGVTFGDADADTDFDGDAHVDADAHVGMHADVDAAGHADAEMHADMLADGDADHPVDGAHATPARIPFYVAAMSWLGVGRVPLSLLLMVLLMSWGLIGFLINATVYPAMENTLLMPALSLPAAAAGSLLLTSCFARFMGRWVPMSESYARRRHELLGLVGEALYPINHDFGMVSVRDDRGQLFQIPCRVIQQGEPIEKGTRVRLVAYNGKQRMFYVTEEKPAVERA